MSTQKIYTNRFNCPGLLPAEREAADQLEASLKKAQALGHLTLTPEVRTKKFQEAGMAEVLAKQLDYDALRSE